MDRRNLLNSITYVSACDGMLVRLFLKNDGAKLGRI